LSEIESVSSFTQLPVTAVDQICFTSCFAYVNAAAVPQRYSVHRTKRVLTDTDGRTTMTTLSTNVTDLPHSAAATSGVMLRSQKRPLVRPSSIAFSSVVVDDCSSSSSVVTMSTFSREQASAVVPLCRSDHHVTTAARKSRSLEDILNSPAESSAESTVVRSGGVTRFPPSAMEMLGSSACTDVMGVSSAARGGYWPVTAGDRRDEGTTASSGGGLGSPGSRNSLHGSVEVIEVS